MQFDPASVDAFHRHYYKVGHDGGTWKHTFWRGTPILKCPFDMQKYHEIIQTTKPSVVIELGTAYGGSALFFADQLRLAAGSYDAPRVISIDTYKRDRPLDSIVNYLHGSSTDPAMIVAARKLIWPKHRVMIVLDSDHSAPHVLAELNLWSDLVSPGCYLVVEDTNIHGHPVYPDHGPGPAEALAQWLPKHPEYVLDNDITHLITFSPGGWLIRGH